jgi:hypothetical protein
VTLTSFLRSTAGRAPVRRVGVGLAAALFLAAMVPGTTLAVVATLDQQQTTMDYVMNNVAGEAQTFTAGLAGNLVAVDIWVNAPTTTPITVSIAIRAVDVSGKPTGSDLATASKVVDNTDQFNNFTLSSGVPVTVGEEFAIVYGGSATYMERLSANNPYAGGRMWYWSSGWGDPQGQTTYDLGFKTYVDTSAAGAPDPCASPSPTLQVVNVVGVAPAAPDSAPTICATPPPTSSRSGDIGGRSSASLVLLASAMLAIGLGVLIRRERGHSATR